ncbi:hypothetical protein GCM10009539_22590 [Cryptosporangium japonicum]|uniref:Uncharacterized protein n=1 Tax=Cryptosporangium japonicum TaxID=80872 RepID=A0ABN0U2U5_9ACTN
MDLGEQPTDAVAHAGRLAGQVVVESDQDLQFGECFVAEVDAPQRVGHGPGRVSDDVRVSGIGLGLTGMQISDPAHRQTGQIGHIVALGASDRDRHRRLTPADRRPRARVRGEPGDPV